MNSYCHINPPWRHAMVLHLFAMLLLAGCAPAHQPVITDTRSAAQTVAPAASSAVADPATIPGLPADWEQRWNALVAAARQEGKVVVFGPPTPEMRTRLPEAFKQRFGIELEYHGITGGEYAARLASERAAGVYSADAGLNGADSMYRVLAGEGKLSDGVMGMLVPLRPLLLLPEVLDPTKYRNGKLWFTDPQEQYVLRIANFVNAPMYVNTQRVQPSSLTSWQDLLKPEYKGKIVTYDPTIAGTGLAQATYLYQLFGAEYVRRLYIDQEPFISRDHRQVADLLARGSHPIAVSLQSQEADRLIREGHPVTAITGLVDGPGYVSAGYGLLGVFDKAPHPHAAQVFANWIASREGSQVFQEANRQLSTRNDVDVSTFQDSDIPKPGVDYLDSFDWNWVMERRVKAQADLREILGRRGS